MMLSLVRSVPIIIMSLQTNLLSASLVSTPMPICDLREFTYSINVHDADTFVSDFAKESKSPSSSRNE